jgi:hypothetical protein
MNEKLRQLARDAGFIPDNFISRWDSEFEKLSKLMVFECVNAVMDGTKEGDHYAQRIEQHFDNGLGGILHFGVEE